MKKRGLKVQSVSPEIEAEWRQLAEQAYPLIRGGTVPADLFDEMQRLLREYRAGQREAQR
jgi:TRAP-type transport system periplasmic protein